MGRLQPAILVYWRVLNDDVNVNFVLIERVLSLVPVDILADIHSSFGPFWIYIIGLADTYSDGTSYSDGLAIFTQHTCTFCCASLERLVKSSYVWLRCLLSSSDLRTNPALFRGVLAV